MIASDPNAMVCRHCGGPLTRRFDSSWIHDRMRSRGTKSCPRMPEAITRAEYQAQQSTKDAKQ